MQGAAVLYDRVGPVATITLNRPERRNALSKEMRESFRLSFERFEADDSASVAVLAAHGKSFCAGADLKELASQEVDRTGRHFMPIINRNIYLTKPVIAAVQGHAYGGGFLQAQMCDLVIASPDAMFGMPEARLGRGAPWSVPLHGMIPRRIWTELALTGRPINATRAYEIGLINQIVNGEELHTAAHDLAAEIAGNAPLTVRATREIIALAAEMGRGAAWDVADRLFDHVYSSNDALEGPRAYTEARSPSWGG